MAMLVGGEGMIMIMLLLIVMSGSGASLSLIVCADDCGSDDDYMMTSAALMISIWTVFMMRPMVVIAYIAKIIACYLAYYRFL